MATVALERPGFVTSVVGAGAVPRYSVVRGLRVRAGERCRLLLESPTRELTQLDIPCTPDGAAADDLRNRGLRPLAVRIALGSDGGPRCTALFATPQGARRAPIAVGAALALCAEGRHAIVVLD